MEPDCHNPPMGEFDLIARYFQRPEVALPGGAVPCNLSDTVNTLFPFATSRSDVRSKNYALFGQATYQITEQLSLTGGLRYTWDDLEFTHTRAPAVNRTTGLPATGPGTNGNPAGGTIASGGNGTRAIATAEMPLAAALGQARSLGASPNWPKSACVKP
mgnify:CR=1 FL=1